MAAPPEPPVPEMPLFPKRETPVPPLPVQPYDENMVSKLERLAKLRREGDLSEEEYIIAKRKILGME